MNSGLIETLSDRCLLFRWIGCERYNIAGCEECNMNGVPELKENESIWQQYEDSIRVVRIDRGEDRPLYRFDAPGLKPKDSDNSMTWENPKEAMMFASVYVAHGPFREEKTGKRGIPIGVHQAGSEAVITYLGCQPGMSTDWISQKFDLDRERIYEYRSRVRSRAEEALVEDNSDRDY